MLSRKSRRPGHWLPIGLLLVLVAGRAGAEGDAGVYAGVGLFHSEGSAVALLKIALPKPSGVELLLQTWNGDNDNTAAGAVYHLKGKHLGLLAGVVRVGDTTENLLRHVNAYFGVNWTFLMREDFACDLIYSHISRPGVKDRGENFLLVGVRSR